MRKWITLSTLLHLLVFLLLWLGLPSFNKPLIEPTQIVPVDIASVADITAVKVAPPQKAAPTPEPKPEPPKPPEPKPEPKPPEPTPPAPKPAPSPAPAPEPKPQEQKVEEKAEPLPTPKPKPPKPEPPKEQKDPLASILKNVSKMKAQEKTEDKPPEKTPTPPKPEAETKPTPQKEPSPAVSSPQVPATAEHLSISEEDALRRQLAQCWNFDPGAKGIDTMAIDIYLSINQDRTVREAVVVDQVRMAADPFFRTMAESAVRALKNPHCSPLALPPEKYDQWKDTIMTFRPKDMM